MRKPKDKIFTDTSGGTIFFKTRHCENGDTGKMINVLDIQWNCENDNQIEFESPSKVRKMAKLLLEHAKWMEKKK